MEYRLTSLNQLLAAYPEEDIERVFSGFRCSRDTDLETFLHKQAIPYDKRELARVYVALTSENHVVGYFSLSMRCGVVPKDCVSKSMYKRLNAQPETDVAQMYLIGQLGRSDDSDKGLGKRLMADAMNLIRQANGIVGCPVVRIDCKPALIPYYETYGFRPVRMNDSDELMMMVCILKPQFPWEPEGENGDELVS